MKRELMRSLALIAILLSADLLAACGSDSTPTPGVQYQTYTFSADFSPILAHDVHPGDDLTINWLTQQAGMTTASNAQPITLTLKLYGPVASKEEAQQLMDSNANPVASTTVQTNNRAQQLPPATLKLPPTAALGMYNLQQLIDTGSVQTGGATIVQVVKR